MASPIVTATLQSGILAGISNILAQGMQCWEDKTPFSLDATELLHFTLYSVMACPPNFIWQTWLEAQYPGYAGSLRPLEKEKLVDDVVTGQSTGLDGKAAANASRRNADPRIDGDRVVATGSRPQAARLNVKNTAIKFALDNTFGAIANTLMFIIGLGLLRGKTQAEIRGDVDEQFWTMIYAGSKLWPAVSVLSLTAVPVQHRTTFGAVIGVFWGIYLSILTSQRV